MNKKILIGSILAVFMLVAISYATAVNNNTNTEKKESPLYGIRTRRVISEKITNIVENIKTKFLRERIFFIPLQGIRARYNLYTRMQLQGKGDEDWTDTPGYDSCYQTCITIPGCLIFTAKGPEYCYDTESHPKCYPDC